MVAEYFTREGQTSAFINSILFDGATDGTEEVEEGDSEQESQVDMEGDVGYLEGSYQEENNGLDNFDLAKMKSLKELESAILNKGDRVRAEKLLISLPTLISSQHPKIPRMIGEFTLSSSDISPEDLNLLQVPLSALSASWAARRLSIVGKHCRRTYCFTHSYGRLYDKSSGSLYWEVSWNCVVWYGVLSVGSDLIWSNLIFSPFPDFLLHTTLLFQCPFTVFFSFFSN